MRRCRLNPESISILESGELVAYDCLWRTHPRFDGVIELRTNRGCGMQMEVSSEVRQRDT
jgi:hypothetical protein